ncbi:MAG: hypothetical protein AAFV62_06900 [Pseudomonadota bacterium]
MHRRDRVSDDFGLVDDAAETARGETVFREQRDPFSRLSMLVALLAIFFSGVSLYQTVLKQAEIQLFVPDTIAYTRDPNGSFEVLVVPVTLSNSGAREGVVSAFTLTARNRETGREREFEATYLAEPGYLSAKEDYNAGIFRPKRAFSPIVAGGRGGHSATLLFYPRAFSEERVVPGAADLDLTIQARVVGQTDTMGVVSWLSARRIEPLALRAQLPKVSRYFDGEMMSGKNMRLFVEPREN